MGCPIRRSRDHRALAPPPSFSQRATSFIASRCQGIHQMPFSCSPTPSPKAALRGQRTEIRGQRSDQAGLSFAPCLLPSGADASASPLPGFPLAYLHTHARARPIRRARPEGRGGLSCHARFTVTTRFTMSKRLAAHTALSGARADLVCPGSSRGGSAIPSISPTPVGGPGPIRTADLTLIRRAL